jgi:signal peptidase II
VRLGRGPIAYLIAITVIVLDQLTKAYIVHGLSMTEGMSRTVLGPIRFTFVYNSGFSFGLMQDTSWGRWILSGFSATVAILLAVWARRVDRPWLAIGIGLVMGGAVGNLIDRVLIGHVVDFVDASGLMFPWIFNVADAGISVGVGVLVIDQFFTPQARPAPPTAT